MKFYTIDKNTMKAVKGILKEAEKSAGTRNWMKFAYLYSGGLICTDGRRLLKVHEPELEKEFEDFIRETGRVIALQVTGDGLSVYAEADKNDSNIGMMERIIMPEESFGKGTGFVNRFGLKKATTKDISASMLNTAILSTGRWFEPSLFDGMGVRPWARAVGSNSMAQFKTDGDEYFVCMGLAPEDVR